MGISTDDPRRTGEPPLSPLGADLAQWSAFQRRMRDYLLGLESELRALRDAIETDHTHTESDVTDLHSKPSLSRNITMASPTATEDRVVFFTNVAITVVELRAVVRGSSSPSIEYNIVHSTDRSAAGNDVMSANDTVTSETTGDSVTSFAGGDPTIPANSWVWVETGTKSGTVDELSIVVRFTED